MLCVLCSDHEHSDRSWISASQSLLAILPLVAAIQHIASGKVRDVFQVDDERLLIVASDRISAFDVVLSQEIPHKGQVLTGLSSHWFNILNTPHHLISIDTSTMDFLTPQQQKGYAGRAMLVVAAEVIPMECVVRGYLYGSSWREYSSGGGPTTEHLPSGLERASKLPTPTFTPASKAYDGHDQNLTEAEARALVGDAVYEEVRARSIDIYVKGAEYAAERGIILADTKFEFGEVNGEIILIDEVLTPDSSRYWPEESWVPGTLMPSLDKQPVRDWLEGQDEWGKTSPAPLLPREVIQETSDRYVKVYEQLTGDSFHQYCAKMGAS